MSMNYSKLDINDAKTKISSFPYSLVYLFGEVLLRNTDDLHEIDWSDCLEARFFGENGELRFFRENGKLVATMITGSGEVVDKVYKLDKKLSTDYRSCVVRKYVNYDEDGQAFICGTTLLDLRRDA